MKKTLVKLGAAALALTLALVFAACAQPTEESSGPNAPTIIRLVLDRDGGITTIPGGVFQLRVGEDLLIPAATINYPYPAETDTAGVTRNAGKTSGDPILDADRNKVVAIGSRAAATPLAESVIKSTDPKKKYLVSGEVTIGPSIADTTTSSDHPIQVDPKGAYYVDIELINQTPAAKERGSVFAGNISAYVEMSVSTAIGSLDTHTYMYTKDKHGFNDLWKMDGATARWNTSNSNIKKVSLKPGINEVYLSYFSWERSED
ncbi:MAG: hypothetical protein LBK62_13705 [Treponema sp.]|jgi:hypothetical protein|nr:hypothetical protein [Treponema sp.]